jgi:CxxC-x17-CxxC domain-containing protein
MARRRRYPPRRGPKRRVFKRSYNVVCAQCGKELKVEVPPPPGETLICLDCYKKEEEKKGTA